MTPVEIKNKEFKKMLWGYSPIEVIHFLDGTAKAIEKVQKQERGLVEEISKLNAELAGWKGRESQRVELENKARAEAENIRAQALKEGQKILTEAKERAEKIRQKTEEWLEQIIVEVEEAERQRQNFRTAFKSTLDEHYALLREESLEAILSQRLNQLRESISS